MVKRNYTPSFKQKALNDLHLAISKYTNLVEAENKRQIVSLMRTCFKHGVTQDEVAKACSTSSLSVKKIMREAE